MTSEVQKFDVEFKPRVQQNILRAVYRGCREAYTEALSYGRDRLVDAVPELRRLKVEDYLGQLVYGPGFALTRHPTRSSTYLQIESPGVVMTSVTRTDFVSKVEPYIYRDSLARRAQRDLFVSENDGTPIEKKLFALLIYGGDLKQPGATQCRVVFPLEGGTFHEEEIDLRARYVAISPDESSPEVLEIPQIRFVPAETEAEEEG